MTLLLLLGRAVAGGLDALPSLAGPGEDQPVTEAVPVGDLNGDGRGDLALGVPEDDGAGHEAGALWLVLDAAALAPWTPLAEVGTALRGEGAQDAAGRSVAALGDTDGDGLDDLAVAAPEASDFEPAVGVVYLLSGGAIGEVEALGELPRVQGLDGWGRLGARVHAGGDLDQDGLQDLLVAAPYPTPSGDLGQGWVGLVLGQAGGWEGVRTLRLVSGASPSTSADAAWTFSEGGSLMGRALLVLPDAGGDGAPELLIGLPGYGSHDHSPPPPDADPGEPGGHATGLVLRFPGPLPEALGARPVYDEGDADAAVEGHLLEELPWLLALVEGGQIALAAPEAEAVYLFTELYGSVHSTAAPVTLSGTAGDLTGWGMAAVGRGLLGQPLLALGEPGWGGGEGRLLLVDPTASGGVEERAVLTLEGCLADGLAGFAVRSHPGPDPQGADQPWLTVVAPEASVQVPGDGATYLLTQAALQAAAGAGCGEAPWTAPPDEDGDGFTAAGGDCDEAASWRHPGALEVCGDGVDDDCDGGVDEDCGPPLERRCGGGGLLLLLVGLGLLARRGAPLWLVPGLAWAQERPAVEDLAWAALEGSGGWEYLHGPVLSGTLGEGLIAIGNYQGTTSLHSAGEVHLLWGDPRPGRTDLGLAPVTLHGDDEHDYFGVSLDLGGAGLVVGADRSGLTERSPGLVTLWRDPAALQGQVPASRADLVLTGDDNADALGRQVVQAGDLDGDGVEDWALAAPQRDSAAGEAAGAVWLVHGGFAGLEGAQKVDGAATGLIGGQRADTWLGWRVLACGDLDGDGLEDLIVGELGGTPAFAGSLWWYPGPLRGEVPPATDAWVGESAADHLGFGLAVGDLDGDGAVEIAAGAPGRERGRGQVLLLAGVPEGREDAQDAAIVSLLGAEGEGLGYAVDSGPLLLALAPWSGTVRVLDATLSLRAELSAQGLVGGTTRWLDDMNADQVPDPVVVAPNTGLERTESGVAWLLDGAALVDGGLPGPVVVDSDGDGAPQGEDCDDADPLRTPGLAEVCRDGLDNDCDWAVDEEPCMRGCASAPPGGGAAAVLLAVLLTARRRVAGLALGGMAGLAACRAPTLDLQVPPSPLSGEVTLTATGNFEQLVLLLDGVVLGGGPGPGLSLAWDTTEVQEGEHTLSARGLRGAREPVEVTEQVEVAQEGAEDAAPTLAFLQPLDGDLLALGEQRIALEAQDDGGLARVEVLLDGELLAELDPAGPYELLWTPEALGTYVLKARVEDEGGQSAQAAVGVEVVDGGAISCKLSSPLDGASVSGVVPVRAAVASDAGVRSVEFTADGALLGSDGTAPWGVDWNSEGASGEVVLGILATDGAGASCEDSVTVAVLEGGGDGLTVTITRPTDGGTVFGSAAPVSVAAGGGAGVEVVELYVDGVWVAEDSSSPYELKLDTTALPNGARELVAVAVEAGTGATAEDRIAVTVDN